MINLNRKEGENHNGKKESKKESYKKSSKKESYKKEKEIKVFLSKNPSVIRFIS